MRQVCIYLNGHERIVIYKEGGCQFERNLGKGFGWIVDHDSCRDWKAAITEAQAALASVMSNLELVS
jgi:hypothetical protein